VTEIKLKRLRIDVVSELHEIRRRGIPAYPYSDEEALEELRF